MNKYILNKLAQEHKISPKHAEEIIDGFYRGLRYYLEHADETKGGIVITNYMKFFVDLHREMKSIEVSLSNGLEPKRIEVFKNLIKYRNNKVNLSKKDYARQEKIQSYIAQYDKRAKNSDGETTNEYGKSGETV